MPSLSSIVCDAQPVLDWFQRTETVEPNPALIDEVDAIFVMGHHHLTTLLDLTRVLKESRRVLPVAISGGLGRGTVFVRRKIEAFFSAHELPLPPAIESHSEARLIAGFLDAVRCPKAGDWYLEEKAPHTTANCQLTLQLHGSALRLNKAETTIAIVQCPTQRFRATAAAVNVFKCKTKTLLLAPIALTQLAEIDQVIHIFRLVGLRSRGIEGELEILKQFHVAEYNRVPNNIRNSYDRIAESFDQLVAGAGPYWNVIRHVAEADPAKAQQAVQPDTGKGGESGLS